MQDTGKHQLRDTNASLAAPLGPSHHLHSPSGTEQEIKARGDPERGFEAGKSGNVFIAGLIIYQDKLESRALRIREIPTELSLPALHPARSCFWGLPTSFLQLPGFQFPSSRGKTHRFFFWKCHRVFPCAFPSLGRSWLLLLPRSDNLAEQTWHRERDNSQPRQLYLDRINPKQQQRQRLPSPGTRDWHHSLIINRAESSEKWEKS